MPGRPAPLGSPLLANPRVSTAVGFTALALAMRADVASEIHLEHVAGAFGDRSTISTNQYAQSDGSGPDNAANSGAEGSGVGHNHTA